MRYIFARNYRQLILVRRGWTLLGCVAILLSALIAVWVSGRTSSFLYAKTSLKGYSPELLQAVTCAFVVAFVNATSAITYMLLLKRHNTLAGNYTNAIEISAAVLRASAVSRLHGIIDAMPDIFKKGEAAKQDLIDAKHLDQWPQEGRKWPILGVWMSRRVEHIELFMQLEMWRIRRIHYGLRVVARWLSIIVFVLTLLIFGLLLWLGQLAGVLPLQLSLSLILAVISLVIGIGFISKLSFSAAIPDLNIIEKTLLSGDLRGHHDTQLHVHLADLVYRLLGGILRAEETQKRG
jgi:hypothetical protein